MLSLEKEEFDTRNVSVVSDVLNLSLTLVLLKYLNPAAVYSFGGKKVRKCTLFQTPIKAIVHPAMFKKYSVAFV